MQLYEDEVMFINFNEPLQPEIYFPWDQPFLTTYNKGVSISRRQFDSQND